ncbi:MAG: DUF5119 domain-containing protein [Bacteroidales bacterium]
MRKISIWNRVVVLLILFAGTGCRKDLCYDHNHATNVEVRTSYNLDWRMHWEEDVEIEPSWDIDWTPVYPQEPDGVRLVTYPHYSGLSGQTYNMPKYGGKLNMSAGYHDMLFYNNDTEYILFGGHGDAMMATTRTRTRASYSKLYPDEVTVNPPDMLFGAFFEDLYIEDESELHDPTNKEKILEVKLMPRVFSYVIHFEFKSGLEYVAQARGALSGMAGSVTLSNGHTDNNPVTLLFDCTKKKWGCQAIIRSFGVPGISLHDSKSSEDTQVDDPDITKTGNHISYDRNEPTKVIEINETYNHRLTLELYLINGKEKLITIDVTDQVNKQPRGGVIVAEDLEVTEEEGEESSGGGFDTEVDGWEDDKVVDIPID